MTAPHQDSDDMPEPDYEIVVPFKVCISAGGPYDDEAFVAGFQAGQIDQALQAAATMHAAEVRFTVYTTLVKQLELIGMSRGFAAVQVEECDGLPEWSFISFSAGAERP